MTSKLALCPSCGKSVYFQGSNNVAACSCHKVWYREGDTLINTEISQIHGAWDMIQPGTTGTWNEINFSVTGRLRFWFEDSVYNYWSLDCSDGMIRYLAEGYGMYAVYEALKFDSDSVIKKFKSKSNDINLPDGREFWVTSRSEISAIEIEGSAYLTAFPREIKSIEAASDLDRIEIIGSGTNAVVYVAYDLAPELLSLSNIREMEPRGRKFSCHHCSGETLVVTFPYAQSWVCSGCNKRYSLSELNGHVKAHGGDLTAKADFYFDLGDTLGVEGVDYRVVGYAQKFDTESRTDHWNEYTLFHQLHGFAFVTEAEGHWTILKEIKKGPKPTSARNRQIDFEEKIFSRFSRYHFGILYAAGEFPGDFFSDHREILAMDYIAPPEILSFEKDNKGRVAWFHGKYVNRKVIQAQAREELPKQIGVGAAQPALVAFDTATIFKSGIVALLLVFVVQILTGNHANRTIFNSSFTFSDSLTTQTFVIDKFELEKWRSGLELNFSASMDNSWLELNATLVNTVDGTEYSAQKGTEFYFGSEGGENWTEGSRDGVIYFTKIPRGTYLLYLTAIRDPNMYSQPRSFTALLKYDAESYRNIWMIVLLVLIVPVILWCGRLHTESQRWAGSSYSKF